MKGSTLAKNTEAPRARRAAPSRTRVPACPRDELLAAYRMMLLSRRIDDKEIQLKNQSLIFFQISGAGHEAILRRRRLRTSSPATTGSTPTTAIARCASTLGMTPLEMLLAAVGAKDDPNSGGRQMPSHWGHRALNIPSQGSPTGTQCLQAVGCAEAGMIYEPRQRHPRSRESLPRRRSHLRLARRRRHQRRRVLGIAEHRLHQAGAGALPGRGQRLRHLGAGRSADARRRHLASWSRRFPEPARCCAATAPTSSTATARSAKPWTTCAASASRRSCTPRSRAPTRTRCRTTSGSTRRRRNARPKPAAIRSSRMRAFLLHRAGLATEAELAALAGRASIARSREATDAGARRRRSRAVDTAGLVRLLARRRSDLGRVRDGRRSPRASPTRWSPRSTAR